MSVERLRSRRSTRGAILMYHRIADQRTDPWRTAVSPTNFAAHIDVLRDRGDTIRLSDLMGAISGGGRPQAHVAVTFDDGYVDNLTHALPILETRDIPATVFVVSGLVGRADGFWWEALRMIFLETPELPETLSLCIGPRRQTWQLGEAALYPPSEMARAERWSADEEGPQDQRQRVFLSVWETLLDLDPAERRGLLAEIADWAALPADSATACRPVDAAELRQLAGAPLIDIGGHTVSHPNLSALAAGRAAAEIRDDRRTLVDMTGHTVEAFGYPFGLFNAETPGLIADAGYAHACCSRFAVATAKDEPFRLPRIQVSDLSGPAFAALLDRVLGPAVNGARSSATG